MSRMLFFLVAASGVSGFTVSSTPIGTKRGIPENRDAACRRPLVHSAVGLVSGSRRGTDFGRPAKGLAVLGSLR